MMKIRHVLLLLLILPYCSFAQTIISGVANDSKSGGIKGVVVKVLNNGNTTAYSITDDNGRFELKFNIKEADLLLSFEHLTYNKLQRSISNRSQTLDVILTERVLDIETVTVSAPMMRQRGDTLSYHLASFTGRADVSLEDAMKNLPGITIAATGKIQYQGKDINRFYIEGLDMLGGRYGVATKSLPATAVATVEVMENHQQLKQLRNRIASDDVAINIKLNKDAKVKPSGNIEAAAGYGQQEFLYRLALTGMMFFEKFQTISTAKIGNSGVLGSQDVVSHFDDYKEIKSNAFSLLGDISASVPPLNENRYRRVNDRVLSINTINKLSEDAVLKANLDYSYNQNSYFYETYSSYYTQEGNVVVQEQISPLRKVHKPALSIEYNLNDSTAYIRNKFLAKSSFEQNTYNVDNSLAKIGQQRDATMVKLTNSFDISKRKGENLWSFSSFIDYTTTPENRMIFSGVKNVDGDFYQSTSSKTFFTKEEAKFSFNIGEQFRVYTPVKLEFSYDMINTDLIENKTTISNNIRGSRFTPSLSPQFEFNTSNKRFTVRANLPVVYSLLNYNNIYFQYSRVMFNPDIYLNYILSTSLKLQLTGGISHQIGDLLDLLTHPIQINYRVQNLKSGILAENRNDFANLRLEYKLPLDFFFVNAQVGYSNMRRNLLSSQLIDQENIINSSILFDNNSKSINSNLSITKQFQPIKTKITIGGSYNWAQGDIMQQGIATVYNQRTMSFNGNLVSRPWKWIELNYTTTISLNTSQFSNVSQSLSSQSHFGKLAFFTHPKLQLYSKMEYVRNEIAPSIHKDMALFDVGVSYKFKSVRLELSLNNIFNTKQYTYTIFNGLDNFSYNYRLRGRECMISVILF